MACAKCVVLPKMLLERRSGTFARTAQNTTRWVEVKSIKRNARSNPIDSGGRRCGARRVLDSSLDERSGAHKKSQVK
jgi:hypothetical protein